MEIQYSELAVKQIKEIVKSDRKSGELILTKIEEYAKNPSFYPDVKLLKGRLQMIDVQIIKDGKKPVAVILDITEYQRLREIEQDRDDYFIALETKLTNKKWTSHELLKNELEINN